MNGKSSGKITEPARDIDVCLEAGVVAGGGPHCIAMGEAAGTASALAVKQGIHPRQVDFRELQESLLKNGALLPGIEIG